MFFETLSDDSTHSDYVFVSEEGEVGDDWFRIERETLQLSSEVPPERVWIDSDVRRWSQFAFPQWWRGRRSGYWRCVSTVCAVVVSIVPRWWRWGLRRVVTLRRSVTVIRILRRRLLLLLVGVWIVVIVS
jgi:hypothetical protein